MTDQEIPTLQLGAVTVYLGQQGGKYPDGNYVVVDGGEARASFDMPPSSRDVPPALLGQDLVILGHVHEDHTCGLDRLPDTPTYVHSGDIDALRSIEGLGRHYGYSPAVTEALCARAVSQFHFKPRPDALAYEDGQAWDLGNVQVHAVHAPGHTSGHCILLVEPMGAAFIGDIDLTGFGPYYGDASSSLADFRRSLKLVRDLDARYWITSHHRGVVSDRSDFLPLLERYGAVLDRRDASIVQSLRERPMSLQELAARRFVYPASFDDVFVNDVEMRCIAQHLQELQSANVVREGEGGIWQAM